MKTKARNAARDGIRVITLGCSKNRVDSEVLIAQLRGSGKTVTHEEGRRLPGTIVINTCGFIDAAKEQSVQTILECLELKRQGKVDRVVVMGCLVERYREDLEREMPGVDGFHGTSDLPALVKALGADYRTELLGERQTTTGSHTAYLKISEGCNRGCSFCAIPLMRGRHVSRDLDFLVNEAKYLVSRGVKEIMLIAQDLTYYGLDLYGERRLPDLLDALSGIEGLRWLRLHYAYPAGFPHEILPLMRERANICKYLDIPFQHISTRVLKRMRRAIDKPRTLDLIARIREGVPGIAIRSTLLVGHPGEQEEDHQELLDFLRATRLERVGVFTYSHEENTHSHTFPDDVPPEVKERRRDEVMRLQQEVSAELNAAKVGRTLEVLIDRAERGGFVGRTEHDSPEVDNEVFVQARGLHPGDMLPVRITGASEYDLEGEPIR